MSAAAAAGKGVAAAAAATKRAAAVAATSSCSSASSASASASASSSPSSGLSSAATLAGLGLSAATAQQGRGLTLAGEPPPTTCLDEAGEKDWILLWRAPASTSPSLVPQLHHSHFSRCLDFSASQVRNMVLRDCLETLSDDGDAEESGLVPGDSCMSRAMMDLGSSLAQERGVQQAVMHALERLISVPRELQDSDSDGSSAFGGGFSPIWQAGEEEGERAEPLRSSETEEGEKPSIQLRLQRLTEKLEAIRRENIELRSQLAATCAEKADLEQYLAQQAVGNDSVQDAVKKLIEDSLQWEDEIERRWKGRDSAHYRGSKALRRLRRECYRWAAAGLASVIVASALALCMGVNPFKWKCKFLHPSAVSARIRLARI